MYIFNQKDFNISFETVNITSAPLLKKGSDLFNY